MDLDEIFKHTNFAGADNRKLVIDPKVTEFVNTLEPGPDRQLMMTLVEMVHQISVAIDKAEPNDMKDKRVQPGVYIKAPVKKCDKPVTGDQLQNFLDKHAAKDESFKQSKDYKALSALADMHNNPVGEKPVSYRLKITDITISHALIDLADDCKIKDFVVDCFNVAHCAVIFKMNTGLIGGGCLDIPTKLK